MSAQYKGQLKWVAENVCEIHTIKDDPGKCAVQITYWLSDDYPTEDVTGHGKTLFEAFIRAMNKAREEQARSLALSQRPKRKR